MAKSKKHKSPVKRKKALSTKSKVMTTKKRRKKSTAVSHRRRSPIAVPRRKSKRRLSAGGSSLKVNAMHNLAGTTGGGVYGGIVHLTKNHVKNHWLKFGGGITLAMGMGMAGMSFAAAGAAGAAGSDLVQSVLQHGLMNDGEMSDVEYVHPDTLSDSGFEDGHGNMMLMDSDGMCYAPDEEGTYHAVGDQYSLSEATNMESVSMLPLQEAHNPYNLSEY